MRGAGTVFNLASGRLNRGLGSVPSVTESRSRSARRGALLLFAALLVGPVAANAADADLSITFAHFPEPGVGLQQLIYSIRITNAGPSPATSIRLVNTLPPGAIFDSAGAPGWDCTDPAGGVLTCTYASLAVGVNTSFLGIAVIPPAQGGLLSDTATVSAIETDPVPANNTGTETVVVNPAPPLMFYSVAPCRLVDTRDPVNPRGGPALAANATREFFVTTFCDVSPLARAIAVNVTVVGGSDVGDLRIYPRLNGVPTASTINFAAGQVRANSAIVPLYQGGMSVLCDMPPGSTGTVHFLLDVTGYFQ